MRVSCNKNFISVTQTEEMTTGAKNVFTVYFDFDEAWENLTKSAVFKTLRRKVTVILDESNTCSVPWEVLELPGELYISVFGMSESGAVKLPTMWAELGKIKPGAEPGTSGKKPTVDAYAEILMLSNEMKEIAQSLRNDADNGVLGEKGDIVYSVDLSEANGIYCDGNINSNNVNSTLLLDPDKKYRRLKLYAKTPFGLKCEDFPLDTKLVGAYVEGKQLGNIFMMSSDFDPATQARLHEIVKLDFEVTELDSGWKIQIRDAGWYGMGINPANASQYSGETCVISGTKYMSWNQRHNDQYCIYKIAAYR